VQDVDYQQLRRQLITALAADDALYGCLILKGGNAMSLIHEIGSRASLDLDYSMEADVVDYRRLGARVFFALRSRLGPRGLVLFDDAIERRPSKTKVGADPRWGGYHLEFKLISKGRFDEMGGELARIRRASLPAGGGYRSGCRFRIEISKYECCHGRTDRVVDDGFVCQVYTPTMLAAEKLRALCQQMAEYPYRLHPTARARDFYDLHALIAEAGVDLSEMAVQDSVLAVFAAKHVTPSLLGLLGRYRDFHKSDWPGVLNAIPASRCRDYDFYFDFVMREVVKLEPLWVVDTP